MIFPQTYLAGAKLLGVVFLMSLSAYYTHRYDIGQEALRMQEQKEALLKKNADLETEIQTLTEDYVNQAEKIRVVTKTIVKEIPKVITNEVDNKYPLSNGFVRLHDSSTSGVLIPEDPSRPDGGSSSVKESNAIGTISDNYESCKITRERLIALQKIVKEIVK